MNNFKTKEYKRLLLKGKTAVFIDWANVYGWSKSLKREIDPAKLLAHLKTYQEIIDIRLYFGEDTHPKSIEFLQNAEHLGYSIIRKPVKYIPVAEVEGEKLLRRKCDFDMEVCIDVHAFLAQDRNVQSFVFFTGDGDYEPLYKMLIGLCKQIIVVYIKGHLGREIWAMKRGIFKVELKNLMEL